MAKKATAVAPEELITRMEERNKKLYDAAVSKGVDLEAMAESIISMPSNAKKGAGRLTSQLIQQTKEAFMDHVSNVILVGNQDRLDSPIPIKVHMISGGQLFEANTWGLSTKINGTGGSPITFPSKAADVVLEMSKDARYQNYSLVAMNGYCPASPEEVLGILAKLTMSLEQLKEIALNDTGGPTYVPVVFAAKIKDIRAIPAGWTNPTEEERAAGAKSAPEGYYPIMVEDQRQPPNPHPCFTANAVLSGSPNVMMNLRLSAPKYSEPWVRFEEPLIETNEHGIAIGGIVRDAMKDANEEGSGTPEVRAAELLTDDLVDTPVIVVGTIVGWKVGANDTENVSVAVSAMLETRTLVPPGGGSVQAGLKAFEVTAEAEEAVGKTEEKATAEEVVEETAPEVGEEDIEDIAEEVAEEVAAEPAPIAAKVEAPKRGSAKSVFHRGETDDRMSQVIKAVNGVMLATKKFVADIPDDDLLKAVKVTTPDVSMDEIQAAKAHFTGKAK